MYTIVWWLFKCDLTLYELPLLWFLSNFFQLNSLRNKEYVTCLIPEENVCLRGIVQLHFSLLFTFENSVNMLWSCLRGDSFSNQLEWTGTHLYSSSRVRVAGKQSARYFQFGLAKHFLLCCESGLEAFFDEREARPRPEPVPWNKQWREQLTKRLECWRPNPSLTSPSLSFRAFLGI